MPNKVAALKLHYISCLKVFSKPNFTTVMLNSLQTQVTISNDCSQVVKDSLLCVAEELRNLRDEYLSATTEGKKFMEQRFGKRVIQKAVEESFSRDWLNENCKSCPRCGTNIQVGLPLLVIAQ